MTSDSTDAPASVVAQVPHLYDGYYINLDRSVDRRERFERQIERLGLSGIYRRFPAVDGSKLQPTERLKPRSVGAFMSQRNVLVEAKNKKPFVHILEDDTIFSARMAPAICFAIEKGLFNRFDLIFTDIAVQSDLNFMRLLEANYERAKVKGFANFEMKDLTLFDLSKVGFAGLPSFVVNAKRIDQIVEQYDKEIARGPNINIDLFIRREIYSGRLRAACFFPFLSTVGFRDVVVTASGQNDEVADTRVILALLRYAYFIDSDLDGEAMPVLEEILQRSDMPEADSHRLLLQKVLSFILSKSFKSL